MHVLFVTGEFPPMQGGVGDCTNEIARALCKLNLQVSVLTSDDPPFRVGDPPSRVDPPFRVEFPPSAFNVFRLVHKWDHTGLQLLRHAMSVTRADIIHIQYQTAAFGMHPMINFAPRLLNLYPFAPSPRGRGGWGARFVVTFHDLLPMYLFPKAGRVRDWATFQLARGGDAVIATNEQDYARLQAQLAGTDTPPELIPIGSNIDPAPPPGYDRAAWRARLGAAPGETLLCYFGFLNASKGGETLIRALAQIPNARLLMIGGQVGASDATNAQYGSRVEQQLKERGLESRVLWTGFTAAEEVSANFLAADICVLPYRDGASFRRGTLMAALAHGMPIVTTQAAGDKTSRLESGRDEGRTTKTSNLVVDSGQMPRLVDGQNVLLVPPDDPGALARAVNRLASAPELQAHLRRGALALAQHFTWDRIAARHLELYRRLLDE